MPDDLPQRYLRELSELRASGLLIVELALALIFAGIAWRQKGSARPLWVGASAFVVCTVVWAILAWRVRWVCDDAFISFRYAYNWVKGHGLVFNPGERVEGYTNFLWTALVAAGLGLLRIDPVISSVTLGFASAFCALLLCWKLSRDLAPGPRTFFIAPSVVLLAGNQLFAQFTTSGLETMFAATLSLFALERAIHGRRMTAGFAGVLATMAHPDHALAYAALLFALLLDPTAWRAGWRGLRDLLVPYLVPFFVLYVPYFACKALYYGSLVPNTYYAKSAGDAYFSQGFRYILISGAAAGLIGALPLAAASLVVLRNSLLARYVALLTPLYLLYVAKIGGDFMLGRLLVLILLPLAVLLDAGAQSLFARGPRGRVTSVLGMMAASTLLIPAPVVRPREKYHHVADEGSFYPVAHLRTSGIDTGLTYQARELKLALARATELPTMVTGCIGILSYLTGLRIVDSYGLTDAHVARQPITERGRPGHEKQISLAYAVESGGDFSDLALWPRAFDRYTAMRISARPYHLLAYRAERLTGFKNAPNARVPDMDKLIRHYQPEGDDQLACDTWFFDLFYFRHASGEKRRDFVRRMVEAGHLDPALQEFQFSEPGEHPEGYSLVRSFDLDEPEREGFHGTKGELARWSTDHAVLDQSEIGGARGRVLNSFTMPERDQSTGEVWSPEFVIEGDVIELNVAGGGHPSDLRVALEIDAKDVASATGCNTELLGRRLWSVTEHKGQRARISIRDHARGAWGHLIVDQIREWRAHSAPEAAASRRPSHSTK